MNISKIITIVLTVAAIGFLILIFSDPYFFTSPKKIQKVGEAKLEEGILGNKAAFKEASYYFNSLIEQGHANRETYDLLYWSYRYAGHHADAERAMTEALEEYPDDSEFLYQRAESRLSLEQYARAIEDYDKVLAADKNFEFRPDALYSRGAARYKLGLKKEAETDLQQALQVSPDSLQPYEEYFKD